MITGKIARRKRRFRKISYDRSRGNEGGIEQILENRETARCKNKNKDTDRNNKSIIVNNARCTLISTSSG